jgi:hypothetical protein
VVHLSVTSSSKLYDGNGDNIFPPIGTKHAHGPPSLVGMESGFDMKTDTLDDNAVTKREEEEEKVLAWS